MPDLGYIECQINSNKFSGKKCWLCPESDSQLPQQHHCSFATVYTTQLGWLGGVVVRASDS